MPYFLFSVPSQSFSEQPWRCLEVLLAMASCFPVKMRGHAIFDLIMHSLAFQPLDPRCMASCVPCRTAHPLGLASCSAPQKGHACMNSSVVPWMSQPNKLLIISLTGLWWGFNQMCSILMFRLTYDIHSVSLSCFGQQFFLAAISSEITEQYHGLGRHWVKVLKPTSSLADNLLRSKADM